MELELPTDCGNAPRIAIVADVIVNWAKSDAPAVSERLAEDARWTLVGRGTHVGPDGVCEIIPPFLPERVVLLSVVTHGRLASCDGYLETEERRVAFSHAFRFASTVKTANIVEVRSYCIETRRGHE